MVGGARVPRYLGRARQRAIRERVMKDASEEK